MGGDKELLTVITVNYNTSDFIKLMLFALRMLTKNKYKVIICDNGSHFWDRLRLKNIVRRYSNVDLIFRKQSASGSMGHGEALNAIIDLINTPFGVMLDSDAVFLKKDWDEVLMSNLDDEIKIIGAPPPIQSNKPADFPLVYAVLFDVKVFKSLNIDMRPQNPQNGQDTGCEMREKFLSAGYKCRTFQVRRTRDYKEGPFREVICGEFYFGRLNDIFACHFSRGATLGVAKYIESNKFLNVLGIDIIVKKIKGYREKKHWINICLKIIKEQSISAK